MKIDPFEQMATDARREAETFTFCRTYHRGTCRKRIDIRSWMFIMSTVGMGYEESRQALGQEWLNILNRKYGGKHDE